MAFTREELNKVLEPTGGRGRWNDGRHVMEARSIMMGLEPTTSPDGPYSARDVYTCELWLLTLPCISGSNWSDWPKEFTELMPEFALRDEPDEGWALRMLLALSRRFLPVILRRIGKLELAEACEVSQTTDQAILACNYAMASLSRDAWNEMEKFYKDESKMKAVTLISWCARLIPFLAVSKPNEVANFESAKQLASSCRTYFEREINEDFRLIVQIALDSWSERGS